MIIGDFELTNLLGEGAFGQVRLGTNMRTEARVAVKIMELQRIKDLGMSVNVRREISSLKKLRHPNVVKLIEVLKSSSHIYLVCELAEGGDLFDKIAEQELFDEETTRNYFRQILAGVSYCHSMGICHRDLKPENILLAADGTVRISDFGFSRACIDQHAVIQVYTRVGTPNFIAPEVLSGRGYDAFSADVWSAGAVLFVMLAGYLPFDEEDLESLYTKIRRGEFKYPRYVHPLARNLISSMLVVDPLKRNTIEGVLKDPWMTNKHLDKSRVRRTLSTKVSLKFRGDAVSSECSTPPSVSHDEFSGEEDLEQGIEQQRCVSDSTTVDCGAPRATLLSTLAGFRDDVAVCSSEASDAIPENM